MRLGSSQRWSRVAWEVRWESTSTDVGRGQPVVRLEPIPVLPVWRASLLAVSERRPTRPHRPAVHNDTERTWPCPQPHSALYTAALILIESDTRVSTVRWQPPRHASCALTGCAMRSTPTTRRLLPLLHSAYHRHHSHAHSITASFTSSSPPQILSSTSVANMRVAMPLLLLLSVAVLLCCGLSSAQPSTSAVSTSSGGGSAPPSGLCDVCDRAIGFFDRWLTSGVGLEFATSSLFSECLYTSYGSECHTADACMALCSGFMHEYAPLLIARIANSTLDPATLCSEIAGCPAPPPPSPPSTAVPVPSRLNDTAGQPTWPSWKNTTGTGLIAHVSDMHTDLQYAAGSKVHCGLPMCCRAEWGNNDPNDKAGMFGEYNCDTSEALLHSMMDYINRSITRPDLVLYTGDDPAHAIWDQSRGNQLAAINYTSTMLHRYFPDVPVFQTLGNHEGRDCHTEHSGTCRHYTIWLAVRCISSIRVPCLLLCAAFPSDQYGGPETDKWLYSQLPALWGRDLSDDAKRTVGYGGYYQTLVRPGLRVISINSNLYSASNLYVDPANPIDLSYQLNWLEDVLQQLRQRHEKAVIIGHQSPSSWLPIFSTRFNRLLTEYRSFVVNCFWGHTHHSEVQLYTNEDRQPVAHTVGYIGGSVTPYTDTNPGFQMYTYSRSLNDEALVTDVAVYWADLQTANRAGRAEWSAHMVASRNLALTSLTASAWWQLAESIKNGGNETAFTDLVVAYRRGFQHNASDVDPKQWACTMESDTDAKQRACYQRMGLLHEAAPLLSAVTHCDGPSKEEAEEIFATVQLLRAQNQLSAVQQRRRSSQPEQQPAAALHSAIRRHSDM